jgi:hypothetical protein
MSLAERVSLLQSRFNWLVILQERCVVEQQY